MIVKRFLLVKASIVKKGKKTNYITRSELLAYSKKDHKMDKAKIIKAPGALRIKGKAIFLAGSIEMGKAEPWQAKVENLLKNENVTILNPRRLDWDSSWTQSIDNPQFRQQVEWELDAQEKADIIAMYFDPKTKSPITLLELGIFAKSGKLIVCCPEGYWRKENVDITCKRYGVLQVNSIDSMIKLIKNKLGKSA